MEIKLDFNKLDGLIPVVIQDHQTHQILMLGFMNEIAYQKTLTTNLVTFYSRTRKQLWTKGETSGNFLQVENISTDCDNDSLVIEVTPQGDGNVCHEGTKSCFTKKIK